MPFQKANAITLGVALATVIQRRRFVNVGANGLAVVAGAAGDAVGVALEDSTASQDVAIPVAVLDGGILEVEAGAAVVAGVRVMSTATGLAITATGAAARVLGIAQTAAAATGEIISIIGQKAAGEFVA